MNIELNSIDLSIRSSFSSLRNVDAFLSNIIIPIFVIIMISLAVATQTGFTKISYLEDKIDNKNDEKQKQLSICFVLIAVFSCIMMTLRLLINSNWINLIGILLIIGFSIFVGVFPCVTRYTKSLKKDEIEVHTGGSDKEAIFKYIYEYSISNLYYIISISGYTHEKQRILDENREKIDYAQKTFNIKVFIYDSRFQLINVTIMILCTIPTIIILVKNKFGFNLRFLIEVIILITLIISIVHLIINTTRDKVIVIFGIDGSIIIKNGVA